MKKHKKIYLIIIITLLITNYCIPNVNKKHIIILTNNKLPKYHSNNITSMIYDMQGKLMYKIISSKIKHLKEKNLTYFDALTITIFDTYTNPKWIITADTAKLYQNKILYLNNNIIIQTLTKTTNIKKILANEIIINLENNDIYSNNKVILYGTYFISNGNNIKGNLNNKTIELFGQVQTLYEKHI